jgi:hypothetical protein
MTESALTPGTNRFGSRVLITDVHPKAGGIVAWVIDRGNFLVTVQKSNGGFEECKFNPGGTGGCTYRSDGATPDPPPAPGTGLAGFYESDAYTTHLYYQVDRSGNPIMERLLNTRDSTKAFGRPTILANPFYQRRKSLTKFGNQVFIGRPPPLA